MAPKKKKGGKGGKGASKTKKQPNIIDGVNTAELTREKLEIFTLRIKEELDREREDRNYFQIERDKLRTYWDICRHEFDHLLADKRNAERLREEEEEAAAEVASNFEQRVKHLANEHVGQICALRGETLAALQQAHDLHAQQLRQLNADKRQLREQLCEQQAIARNDLHQVKLIHQEKLSKASEIFQAQCRETEERASRKRLQIVEEMEELRRADLAEVDERRMQQTSEMSRLQEAALFNLKDFYNEITVNNISLIDSLKLKLKEMQLENQLADIKREEAVAAKNQLQEPMEKALVKAEEYKKRAVATDQLHALLTYKTKALATAEKTIESLKWKHEVIIQKYDNVKKERDELEQCCTEKTLLAQRRAALLASLLDKRLSVVSLRNDAMW